MGRCKYEKLIALEPAFDQIRQWKDIKEPKSGIFYLKSQGFLHFHDDGEKIWADIKDGEHWGKPVVVPSPVTKKFLTTFVKESQARYVRSGGK